MGVGDAQRGTWMSERRADESQTWIWGGEKKAEWTMVSRREVKAEIKRCRTVVCVCVRATSALPTWLHLHSVLNIHTGTSLQGLVVKSHVKDQILCWAQVKSEAVKVCSNFIKHSDLQSVRLIVQCFFLSVKSDDASVDKEPMCCWVPGLSLFWWHKIL